MSINSINFVSPEYPGQFNNPSEEIVNPQFTKGPKSVTALLDRIACSRVSLVFSRISSAISDLFARISNSFNHKEAAAPKPHTQPKIEQTPHFVVTTPAELDYESRY